MNRFIYLLLTFIASCTLFAVPVSKASELSADDSWLNQESTPWTVNVAGTWNLQLCNLPASLTGPGKAPETENSITLTVQQTDNRIHASNAHNTLQLDGTVSGHTISFNVSGIENVSCMPGQSHLKFSGTAKGAWINGEFSTLPDSEAATDSTPANFSAHIQRKFMLTFDDGPLPGKTDRVLDTLARFQGEDGKPVRAAFFMLGDAPESFWASRYFYAPYEVWINKGSMKKYPDLVNRVIKEGHWIGNHTAHHAWFHWPWFSEAASISSELTTWEHACAQALPENQPKLFRPPYLINSQAAQSAAAQLNYRIVLGHTAGDATPGSDVDYVKNHALKIMETWDQSTPAVLIFHDVFPVTYQHLDEIITYLKNEGYILAHFK